jgi:arylsulfatase A-like enzyme
MAERSLRAKLFVAGTALAGALAIAVTVIACSDGEAQGEGIVAPTGHNVVVILTDDQRLDELAAMPYTNGRDDWVRFEQATVQNPVCCPSRATILSGQYDVNNGVKTNGGGFKFDESVSIANWFSEAGYRTGLFGKYLNDYPFPERELVPPGWTSWASFSDDDRRGGFYFQYTLIRDGRPVIYNKDEDAYSTDVLADRTIQFIEQSGTTPFFAYYAPRAPHPPATPAPRHAHASVPDFEVSPNFNERDLTDKPRWMGKLKERSESKLAETARERLRSLLSVDEAVRRIFETLERTGQLENTYVVFLSDNGYMLGEHRLTRKACPYEECVRVPMLIRGPGLEPGSVVKQVSNVDLAPTLAGFAGIEPPKPRKLDGVSLAPFLLGKGSLANRPILLHSKPPRNFAPQWWAVRTRRYKLIRTGETNEYELYDLRTDPYELTNLASQPRYAELVEQLQLTLRKLRPNGK